MKNLDEKQEINGLRDTTFASIIAVAYPLCTHLHQWLIPIEQCPWEDTAQDWGKEGTCIRYLVQQVSVAGQLCLC